MNYQTRTTNDSRSLGEITNSILTNAQEVLRDEVRLAKTEIRDELKSALRASAMLATGVVLALFAFGMLLLTVTWALDRVLPLWAAAAMVTAVVAVISGVLILVGRQKIRQVDPKPRETMETMKENVQWVKQQTP